MRFSRRAIRTIALWSAGIVVLALVLLFLSGVFHERVAPGGVSPPQRPEPAARTTRVEAVEEDVTEEFPGTVRALRDTVVAARILAEIRDAPVRAGAVVGAGDVLVVLDARELQARVEQEREGLAAAEARLREAEANYGRTKRLLENDAVSPTAFDEAEARFLASKADVESARNRLEEARVNLSYATVRAPFDAVVIDRFIEPGDTASPGTPLLKLYDPSRLRLEAFVREALAVRLERDTEVTVRIETLGIDLAGRVEEIVPQADPGSRSFLVKVGLPPAENLYPGMFGRLRLLSGRRRRIVVPPGAIERLGQTTFVTLADAARTRRLVVAGGKTADGRVEILSGLTPGEEIVLR